MQVQEKDQVELLKGFGLNYFVRHDLQDTNILLGDYIRLHGLHHGDIVFCHDGNSTVPLFVGNCTPYCSPTNDVGTGWIWSHCNHLRVLAIYGVELSCGSVGQISSTCGFEKQNKVRCNICSDPNCPEPNQKH